MNSTGYDTAPYMAPPMIHFPHTLRDPRHIQLSISNDHKDQKLSVEQINIGPYILRLTDEPDPRQPQGGRRPVCTISCGPNTTMTLTEEGVTVNGSLRLQPLQKLPNADESQPGQLANVNGQLFIFQKIKDSQGWKAVSTF
jgi:hypothetical protein